MYICFERQLHFKASSYKSQMQIHSCRENTKCLGRESSVAKVLEEYNGETGNRDALTSVGLFAVLIWHFEGSGGLRRCNDETFESRITVGNPILGPDNTQGWEKFEIWFVLMNSKAFFIPIGLLRQWRWWKHFNLMTHIYRCTHKGYLQRHHLPDCKHVCTTWQESSLFVFVLGSFCLCLCLFLPLCQCLCVFI